MIWVQAGVVAGQLIVLAVTVRLARHARSMAARAALAYVQAQRAAQWAERAAACVPFPRRTHAD